MRQFNWAVLTPKILQLATEAGSAIIRVYDESHQVDALVAHKADDSPLTLADLASHNIIVAGLADLTTRHTNCFRRGCSLFGSSLTTRAFLVD